MWDLIKKKNISLRFSDNATGIRFTFNTDLCITLKLETLTLSLDVFVIIVTLLFWRFTFRLAINLRYKLHVLHGVTPRTTALLYRILTF